MTRALAGAIVVVIVVVANVAGCTLPPYPNGTITCEQGGTSCPAPLQCVDVKHDTHPVCVEGCGDGVLNPVDEQCDDANDNDFDLCTHTCKQASFEATALTGLGASGGDPLSENLGQPIGLAIDRSGVVYVSAFGPNAVLRVDAHVAVPGQPKPIAKLTAFAGDGSFVGADPSAPAAPNDVAVASTADLAVDGVGNVYVADVFLNVIHRIDAITGVVTTVAANRPRDVAVDDALTVPATTAFPQALAVDGDGTVFFVDDQVAAPGETHQRIRRIDGATGTMTTVATPDGDNFGGVGLGGIAFDDAGLLYALGDDVLVLVSEGGQHISLPAAGCPHTIVTQKKLAVSPDGATAFYATDSDVVRVELGLSSIACTTIASLPASTIDAPIIAATQSPGPRDVVFTTDDEGDAILAADPGNGVVWRIAADGSSPPVPTIGKLAAQQTDIAEDIVVVLAGETDARMSFSETHNCADRYDPAGARLQRGHLEIFVPFPERHVLAAFACNDHIGVYAGNGKDAVTGREGDNGSPENAALSTPVAAVRAHDGNVYIVDRDQNRVRVVTGDTTDAATSHAIIKTFVGPGVNVAGKPLDHPAGIAVDDSGHLLIADSGNGRIVSVPVDPSGNGGTAGVSSATELITDLLEPSSLVFLPYAFADQLLALAPACDAAKAPDVETTDPCGLLIYAERTGHRVRATSLAPLPSITFDLAGTPSTETPTPGDSDSVDDNGSVHSTLRFPRGVMVDIPSQTDSSTFKPNLLIMDGAHHLRRMSIGQFNLLPPSLSTTVTTLTAVDANGVGLVSGDDAVDASGSLRGPTAIAFLDDTHALVVDHDTGTLRLLDVTTGALATVAGLPDGDEVDANEPPVKAAEAQTLAEPDGLAVDVDRHVAYVSEPARHRVRRFQMPSLTDASTWTTDVFPVDDVFDAPSGIAVDARNGDVFVVDRAAHVVWRAGVDGTNATRFAGQQGQRGFTGDGGNAEAALFNAPTGVLLFAPSTGRAQGRHLLFVADTGNNRVRRVDVDDKAKTIVTVLGDGSAGSGGEGAPASAFPVLSPRGLAVDEGANLFVTSGSAVRIVQADTFTAPSSEAGVVDPSDAVATIYGAPPRANFPEPVTRCLAGLAVAPHTKGNATNLVAVDSCLGLVVKLVRK